MSCTVSVSRKDIYTGSGEFDATVFEIQVEEGGEFVQDLQLEDASELITLRNALSDYISKNNLEPVDNEP